MSNVRSVPLVNGEPVGVAKVRAPKSGAPLAGVLMLAFGLPLWVIGAKYSLDGWVLGLNIVGGVFDLPAVVPQVSGWWALGLAAGLGLCYSYVEVWVRPRGGVRLSVLLATLILMLLTHITDVGSTAIAALSPAPGAWPIALWAAAQVWPAALWALFLTYIPEVLIIGGVSQFRR